MGARIQVEQFLVRSKSVRDNAERALEIIKKSNADLVVFPELCLTGYVLGDLWERPSFLREIEYWNQKLIDASASGPAVLFGSLHIEWDKKGDDGRPLKMNSYFFAQNGKASIGHKTLSPNYREFEEARHFTDNRQLALYQNKPISDLLKVEKLKLEDGSVNLGVLICEDGWAEDYPIDPAEVLSGKGADLLFTLSASPWTEGKADKRKRVFSKMASDNHCPVVYMNCVGSQNNGKTVFSFDGVTTIYDSTGEKVLQGEAYLEQSHRFELMGKKLRVEKPGSLETADEDPIAGKYRSIRYSIRHMCQEVGLNRVVVGASGGIDSSVVAALFVDALGPESVFLINMPTRYNSDTTKSIAADLAENLDAYYAVSPIEETVELTRTQLNSLTFSRSTDPSGMSILLSSFNMENVQARDRSARVLAGVASAVSGVFTCNANKSELMIGYSTLYGDQSGFVAPIADLWKGEVYALGEYLNNSVFEREVIPRGAFEVVPSAELSDAHDVDANMGDPLTYNYHDHLFKAWMQWWQPASLEECLEWYLGGVINERLKLEGVDVYEIFPNVSDFIADLEKYWKLFHGLAIAKRIQAPPVIGVSSRAFGFDYRESQGASFQSTKYLDLRTKALEAD